MIYFSELQNKKIYTEDDIEVGRLNDLIFLATSFPKITKLVISDKNKKRLFVAVDYITKMQDKGIYIKKEFQVTELESDELFLAKNVLDQQIIDLRGNKVVRVNDVAIQDKANLYIAGVDIGYLGMLRWLNLDRLPIQIASKFNIKISSSFLSWADIQPLELAKGDVKLRKQETKLKKIKKEDLADYLEQTNISSAIKLLRSLDEEKAAKVIGDLNLTYQAALFRKYKPEKAANIINYMESDEAVDVLLTFSAKKREQILEHLGLKKKKDLANLLKLSTTPVGNILTSEFLTVDSDNSTKEVYEKIKADASNFNVLNSLYVVNKSNQLVGVFNLHELSLQSQQTPVYKFMIQGVIVVYLTTPVEITLNKMIKYKLQSLPVINRQKNILGIITLDDVIKTLIKEDKFQKI